ncbi:hypothetical protein A8L34_29565 [Bacillus sp. FJAT-27264]|uniref:fibronectin type III domain-containing protein n=1 Tax=Paenibacillus sp. (strain DSM 101736 / FJAT-27264) TaxID=1850362 RepID=UPI000807DE5E|nr:hypothetical protein [Bacillus sp. FJAT-27264]OBZ15208.1 hypothetical protein A8L34_29565 [Bacillus sp. FJAT-27264]
MKKSYFLSFLLVIVLSFFALDRGYAADVNLISGKFGNMTDGDLDTYTVLPAVQYVSFPLPAPVKATSFKITYSYTGNYNTAFRTYGGNGGNAWKNHAMPKSSAITSITGTFTGSSDVTEFQFFVYNSGVRIYEVEFFGEPDLTPPAVPVDIQGSGYKSYVNLKWRQNVESDFDHYKIYLDDVYKQKVSTSSATLSGLTDARAYKIQISSVDFTGNESAKSIPFMINPSLAAPFEVTGLYKTIDSPQSVLLRWNGIFSPFFQNYNVYKNSELIASINQSSLSVSGLDFGGKYNFRVTAVDIYGNESPGALLEYMIPLPDTTPPEIPKNLRVVPDRYTAMLSWDAPPDPDLLGYYIYLDGTRVNPTPVLINSFHLTGLKIDSQYAYTVSAVDTSGNISAQSSPLSFRTLTLQTAPAPPGSFTVNSFYKGANLSWLPSSSAKEYIVYMDDTQLFKTVNTNAKVTNLVNGQDYKFAVSAVNEIGESEKTEPITVKPVESSPVDVTLGYSLKDLSDGTTNMFSSYWLILAFVIAIPLGFYVGNRVKGLIVE